MSTTGWPDGAPTRTGTAISDVMAGVSCAVGILAAYCNRLKTGEGDKLYNDLKTVLKIPALEEERFSTNAKCWVTAPNRWINFARMA